MTGFEVSGSSDLSEPVAAGISRRAVLQAGAWSAPVIAVAAAVPTASASVPEVMDFTNFDVWFDWGPGGTHSGIAACTTLWVKGDPATEVTGVSLVMYVPAAGMSTTIAPVIDGSAGNWHSSPGALSADEQTIVYTFTYDAPLFVETAAYTTPVTFHLKGDDDANLPAGLSWTAVASASNAQSATRQGTLAGFVVTADYARLDIAPGTLVKDSDDQLTWSGGTISYDGETPGTVEYLAILHGPNGIAYGLLGRAQLDVTPTTVTEIPPATYNSLAQGGQALKSGAYFVTLSVRGVGGVVEDTTTPITF